MYNHALIEKEILDYWKKKKIFDKLRKKIKEYEESTPEVYL